MPVFERGTIVRVPFPYTDRETRQRRPALVVSSADLGPAGGGLIWVVMITSSENPRWHNDVPLTESFQSFGLPAPSLVRTAKIATIDAALAERLGSLDPDRLEEVSGCLRRHLALT